LQTPYQYLLWDKRAVETINRIMPSPFLDAAELRRQSHYLVMSVTLEMAYQRFMVPKFRDLNAKEHAAFLERLVGELAKIDISEDDMCYEESDVE